MENVYLAAVLQVVLTALAGVLNSFIASMIKEHQWSDKLTVGVVYLLSLVVSCIYVLFQQYVLQKTITFDYLLQQSAVLFTISTMFYKLVLKDLPVNKALEEVSIVDYVQGLMKNETKKDAP